MEEQTKAVTGTITDKGYTSKSRINRWRRTTIIRSKNMQVRNGRQKKNKEKRKKGEKKHENKREEEMAVVMLIMTASRGCILDRSNCNKFQNLKHDNSAVLRVPS